MKHARSSGSPGPAISCLETELALRHAGYRAIAGVDEVGRGCWAGPVYAAAVVLPEPCYTNRSLLADVIDSKLLSPAKRERLAAEVMDLALSAAVAWVEAPLIDQLNILGATRLAMQLAITSLACLACLGTTPPVSPTQQAISGAWGARRLTGTGISPDFVVIDAVSLPGLALPHRPIVRGDRTCLAIAAASIVAKVTRDAEMGRRHAQFPHLALAANKGYGTPTHARALHRAGVTPLHRRSFAPMKYLLGVRDHVAGILPAPVPHRPNPDVSRVGPVEGPTAGGDHH